TRPIIHSRLRTLCSESGKSNGNIRTSTYFSTATSTRFARGRRRRLGRSPRPSKAARRRRRPKPFGGAPHSVSQGGEAAEDRGSHLLPHPTPAPRQDGHER